MKIGVLDSGLGGVAVLKQLIKIGEGCTYIYYSDNQNAPYGSLNKDVLAKRVLEVAKILVQNGAEAILLLCNTATVVGKDFVAERIGVPVFGIAPNLAGQDSHCLVLSTLLTAQQLIAQRINCATNILGLRTLAGMVEEVAPNFERLNPYLSALLAPYSGTKTVLVACTHYIFLVPQLKAILSSAQIKTGVEPLLQQFSNFCKKKLATKDEGARDTTCLPCEEAVQFIFSGKNQEVLYREVLDID